jgi:hypothetical protein
MSFSKNITQLGIRVGFIDNDGKKIRGLTVPQANEIEQSRPGTKFYFQNGDGIDEELSIDQVNQLNTSDLLPTAPACPTSPQVCGPPLVRFFGGGGTGAAANAIISPISSSIIAFDIVESGFGFFESPAAELIDSCGKGGGAKLQVNMENDEEDTANLGQQIAAAPAPAGGAPAPAGGAPAPVAGAVGATTSETETQCEAPRRLFEESTLARLSRSKKIKNITIVAPGDGYIASPDGSLGGNERVWKEPDEGFVETKCGGYYVVQPYKPVKVQAGDTYYPPDGPPIVIEEDEIITLPLVPVNPPAPETVGPTYPVVLIIDDIVVLDPGFGYRPGDKLIIDPDKGATAELIIDDEGKIRRVDVITPGVGFIDLPNLRTNSLTGFNAALSVIFKPIRIDINKPIEEQLGQSIQNQIELISVIDCVGKILPKTKFDIIPR